MTFVQALMRAARSTTALFLFGAGVCAISWTMISASAPARAGMPKAAARAVLTPARLNALLRQGVRLRRIPADLTPSPAQAASDVSIPWKLGCLVSGTSTTNGTNCAFGDLRSRTTVVLFGDSHAAALFPGINAVSEQQHWRLIFMGKAACPYADVRLGNPSCATWRHNTEGQIAQLHPRMVIVTSGDYVGSAQPLSGPPSSDRKGTWLHGLGSTFHALRRTAKHVVFIADVPRMKQPADKCVAAHMTDVFLCTRPRAGAFLWPDVRRRELKLAKSLGVTRVDPASWFCTRTRCPVIVHHILIFKDTQHITPQWAQFLAPMLARKLIPAMSGG